MKTWDTMWPLERTAHSNYTTKSQDGTSFTCKITTITVIF